MSHPTRHRRRCISRRTRADSAPFARVHPEQRAPGDVGVRMRHEHPCARRRIGRTVPFRHCTQRRLTFPLTCGTRESRLHRARGPRASAARCRQVQRAVSRACHFFASARTAATWVRLNSEYWSRVRAPPAHARCLACGTPPLPPHETANSHGRQDCLATRRRPA